MKSYPKRFSPKCIDMPEISISVVSHAQICLIESLLHDIDKHCRALSLELILTLNLDEMLSFTEDNFSFQIKVIRNPMPMGFAANHNQAFTYATGRFFCVMNPDIRLKDDPFQELLMCLKDSSIGVAAPLIISDSGELEDSARRFPTPLKIICKAFGRCKGSDYVVKNEPIFPDWVGGMFMLFPRDIFKLLGGFDHRFFLYYEDVDLCARIRLQGYNIAVCPRAKVVHHARRESHRDFKYLRWHLNSMLRFFCSYPFLIICWLRLPRQFLRKIGKSDK